MHTVDISGLIYWIVSYIANPDVTTPPGELMYRKISFSKILGALLSFEKMGKMGKKWF